MAIDQSLERTVMTSTCFSSDSSHFLETYMKYQKVGGVTSQGNALQSRAVPCFAARHCARSCVKQRPQGLLLDPPRMETAKKEHTHHGLVRVL